MLLFMKIIVFVEDNLDFVIFTFGASVGTRSNRSLHNSQTAESHDNILAIEWVKFYN